ncbi:30S ribosomal protein S13 [Candidatus Woesebacteria bacterium RIFCSPHIGHO2_01_FULL_41_10]|uniref:Small ribosomal subunit protein uS13 n=1 Tax=Candidatus Woesebacteria bacterium RIFCSPHIGHO2_01_FULL_41_10 TaxID=1802500 RepID=A0A1F7YSM9_9BACT|nr:MAG: 30S ribosomal protein S13 [Candidatus Woesebacteria bacterium RIFCSPHIGHO2_01_FULL_41_10]
MARIAGVELQDSWRVEYALTRIRGISWKRSKDVIDAVKIDGSTRLKDLTSDQLSKIAGKLEEYPTEGDLVRIARENISRLRETGTYRGIRHARGLPVRGQRTRSNARTKRGKRKTVGSFRKDEMAKQPIT